MTLTAQAPEHWGRFVSLVRSRAPAFPMGTETQLERDRAAAGQAFGAVSALLDGLGDTVPGAVGLGVSAASTATTSNDAADVANSVLDTGVSMAAGSFSPQAGFLVGGLIMLMRGTHQSLARSDAMVTYLLSTGGYVNTLGRLTVKAMRENRRYVTPPTPMIPDYIRRQGDLFSSWRQRAFANGCNRANGIIRTMDELRPTEGDYYSKRCLIHVGIATGFTGQHEEDNWRMRQRAEAIYIQNFLGADLRRQREQLRRWANAA